MIMDVYRKIYNQSNKTIIILGIRYYEILLKPKHYTTIFTELIHYADIEEMVHTLSSVSVKLQKIKIVENN